MLSESVKEIAGSGQMSVSELLSAIDSERHHGNLSSAIRLFVLNFIGISSLSDLTAATNTRQFRG